MNRTPASRRPSQRSKPWQSELNTYQSTCIEEEKRKVSIMERLDEFSKLLAVSVSRRESLQRMGAFIAGAVLAPLGLRTAWAARPDRCGAFCRGCSSKAQRTQCLAACRACNGNTSRLCGICGAYVCCASSAACCNGTCTAVNSDSNNCGACGNVCAASAPYCIQGACSEQAQSCPGGLTMCFGACRDLNNENVFCGSTCENAVSCDVYSHCTGGVCEPN
jgi:hypothetical protein